MENLIYQLKYILKNFTDNSLDINNSKRYKMYIKLIIIKTIGGKISVMQQILDKDTFCSKFLLKI